MLEGSLAGIEGIDTIEFDVARRVEPHHRPVPRRCRHRRGDQRRARPGEPRPADPARRNPGTDDLQGRGRRAADHVRDRASTTMNTRELTDYVDRYVIDRFTNLTGVADVTINGERRYAMRVWIDVAAPGGISTDGPGRRARHPQPERRNPGRAHREPGPRIHGAVEHLAGQRRRVRQHRAEVGRRAPGEARRRGPGRSSAPPTYAAKAAINGETAISIGIVKQAVANPLDVSSAIKEVLPRVNQSLPKGVVASLGYDSTVFIDRSIRNVFVTILESVALVIAIIILFLHSFRAAADTDRHHSDLADRHLRAHVCDGADGQHPDAARHGAGHRPRRRRCDRDAREHLPSHRGRHAPARRSASRAPARSVLR